MLFGYLKFHGMVRHHGFLFVTLIAANWISFHETEKPLPQFLSKLNVLARKIFPAIFVKAPSFCSTLGVLTEFQQQKQNQPVLLIINKWPQETPPAHIEYVAAFHEGVEPWEKFFIYKVSAPLVEAP